MGAHRVEIRGARDRAIGCEIGLGSCRLSARRRNPGRAASSRRFGLVRRRRREAQAHSSRPDSLTDQSWQAPVRACANCATRRSPCNPEPHFSATSVGLTAIRANLRVGRRAHRHRAQPERLRENMTREGAWAQTTPARPMGPDRLRDERDCGARLQTPEPRNIGLRPGRCCSWRKSPLDLSLFGD